MEDHDGRERELHRHWELHLMFFHRGRFSQIAVRGGGSPVLVLVAGASNIRSSETTGSDVPVDLQNADTAVRIWNTTTQAFETYNPGTNSDDWTSGATTPQKWGPEAAFVHDFRAANPSTPIDIVKIAVDGSISANAVGDSWHPDVVGDLYDSMTTAVTAAKAALTGEGKTPNVAALLWMNGLSDAETTGYAANFNAMITAMRSEWGAASTKVIVGRVAAPSTKTLASSVRAAQVLVADEVADVQAIDGDAYTYAADGYHLAVAGVRDLGEDMYLAYAGTYPDIPVRFGIHTSDKDALVTLSNGNLTVAGSGTDTTDYQSARCDHVLGTGKYYMEFLIDQKTANLAIGMGNGMTMSTFWGFPSDAVCYFAPGGIWKNNANIATYAAYTTGDIVMMAFDGPTGKVWFGKNGTWNGDPAAGTGQATTLTAGSLTTSPRFGATLRRSGDQVTLKLAAADFTYTPPSGFAAI